MILDVSVVMHSVPPYGRLVAFWLFSSDYRGKDSAQLLRYGYELVRSAPSHPRAREIKPEKNINPPRSRESSLLTKLLSPTNPSFNHPNNSMKTTISALLLLLSTVASAASVPMICNAEQCNRDPSLNKCDRTTSCIETWVTAKHHCACRYVSRR